VRRAGEPGRAGAGRADRIGGGDALIPAQPLKEAVEERKRRANDAAKGDAYNDALAF